MIEVENKTVVITGGSKGLGKVLAQAFKNEGANVVICSKNQEEIEIAANEIGVVAFVADVTKEIEMDNLAQFAVEKFGQLHIWINNAGVLFSIPKEGYIDMGEAHAILDVNFFGTVFGARQALKQMENFKEGLIINIISSAALDSSRALLNKIYAASKWAVNGYTKALRAESVDSGISIMSVYPGGIQTDLWRNQKPENINDYMTPEYVVEKIINNLKQDNPEEELIIKRPIA
jgi:NAD(P)-dependent dehydrogenase (short-subunit alcohol dehydrogenase family)